MRKMIENKSINVNIDLPQSDLADREFFSPYFCIDAGTLITFLFVCLRSFSVQVQGN